MKNKYQKRKERLRKEARERYQNLSEEQKQKLLLEATSRIFSKFLILLISFRKLLKDKNSCFLALYICDLNKSNM